MANQNKAFRHLTDDDVIYIRQNASPDNIDALADKFEVSPMAVRYAAQGRTYERLNEIAAPVSLKRKKRGDGLSKVTKEHICQLAGEGKSNAEIGRIYGVSSSYISYIRNGKR